MRELTALPKSFAPNIPPNPEHHIGVCIGDIAAWLRDGDVAEQFRECRLRCIGGRYQIVLVSGPRETVVEDSSMQGALGNAVCGLEE